MMKNGQTYLVNLPVFTLQDFKSRFDHSSLCMEGLKTTFDQFTSQLNLFSKISNNLREVQGRKFGWQTFLNILFQI